jgi:hypothetical protein
MSSFAEVVLFTDCCRLYVPYVEGFGPPFSWPSPSRPEHTKILLGFATALGDAALEPVSGDPDDQRGYFTGALLDGLNGHAADLRTHEVTDTTLRAYVQREVDERARRDKKKQLAELKLFTGQDMVLTEVREVPVETEHLVTIDFGPQRIGTVVLIASDLTERDRWSGQDGPWRLRLPTGLYEVRYEAEPPVIIRVAGGDVRVQL